MCVCVCVLCAYLCALNALPSNANAQNRCRQGPTQVCERALVSVENAEMVYREQRTCKKKKTIVGVENDG